MATGGTRGVLAGIVFAVLFAQVLLYPGIDTLVAVFGVSTPLNASMWFLAVEFLAFIGFAGLWGALSDATGKRSPFIAIGAFGGAIGYASLAILPAITTLPFSVVLLIRALQGASTIGAFSLGMTMLMDLEGGHGRNMGAAGIAIGGGTALGAPLGGQLYELGPVVPLYSASLLLLGVGLLAVWLPDRAPSENRNTFKAIIIGLRNTPALTISYLFGFVDRLTAGFFALVGTFYFRTVFELSPGLTGLMLGLFFVPFALLQYPLGIVSDTIGRTGPIIIGSGLYGLGVIAVGTAPTVETAGLAMVAIGVLGALMAPATMALVTDLAEETERGVAMAGFNVFGSMGFLGGILLGGTIVSGYGYRPAFLVTGGVEIVLAIALWPFLLRIEPIRTDVFP